MAADIEELDPRYEWIEITAWSDREPTYTRGRCLHTELEPVHNKVTGDRVATLCRTCDEQLSPHWR